MCTFFTSKPQLEPALNSFPSMCSSRCGVDCRIQLDIDLKQTAWCILHLTFHYSNHYYKLSGQNNGLLMIIDPAPRDGA